jgi:hypothetical protein
MYSLLPQSNGSLRSIIVHLPKNGDDAVWLKLSQILCSVSDPSGAIVCPVWPVSRRMRIFGQDSSLREPQTYLWFTIESDAGILADDNPDDWPAVYSSFHVHF